MILRVVTRWVFVNCYFKFRHNLRCKQDNRGSVLRALHFAQQNIGIAIWTYSICETLEQKVSANMLLLRTHWNLICKGRLELIRLPGFSQSVSLRISISVLFTDKIARCERTTSIFITCSTFFFILAWTGAGVLRVSRAQRIFKDSGEQLASTVFLFLLKILRDRKSVV